VSVEQIGKGVTGIKAGDKVVLSFASCGDCGACHGGHPAYCSTWLPRNLFTGAREDGSPTITSGGKAIGGHFFAQSSFANHGIAEQRNVVVVNSDADLVQLAPARLRCDDRFSAPCGIRSTCNPERAWACSARAPSAWRR